MYSSYELISNLEKILGIADFIKLILNRMQINFKVIYHSFAYLSI